jgi:3-deoxy-D-manno-octulosonic-acid transferase
MTSARFFYSCLWIVLLPALLLRMWWRGRRAPMYRQRWAERLGFYPTAALPRPHGVCVWVHAVSVGETLAAVPMVEQLLLRYPDTQIVMTTTTPTGSERVRAVFGERVLHVYAPWELPGAVARFFNAFRPSLVLLLETELWPNIVATAAKREVPVMLINGRLSERSQRGYARFPALVKPMLKALHGLAVQTPADAARFQELGAADSKIVVTGSVKFDIDPDDGLRQVAGRWRQHLGLRPVWIAASTHAGEDEPVLVAHKQLKTRFPDALLILVPRHPERFAEVGQLARTQGFSVQKRSEAAHVGTGCDVYLGDTMGELMQMFGFADVAFVGGSLVDVGGHNLLEPSAWGLPVLTGPHLHNFALIAQLLEQAGAMTIVESADALAAQLLELFAENDAELAQSQGLSRRQAMGDAALHVQGTHRGALQRVLTLVSASWPSLDSL